MKKKQVLVCDHCETPLIEAKNFEDLPCIPSNWYKTKDFFKKWRVFHCEKCRRIYQKPTGFDYFLERLCSFLETGFERMQSEKTQ